LASTVDEADLEEIEEQLLLVLVVAGIAGGDLARPVEGEADRAQLLLHRRDIGVGPGLGVDLVLHGGVFSRQAEGVPAHGVQHVHAEHALVARQHVAHGVVAHVAHVDAPRRIGKHLEDVVGVLAFVVLHFEGVGFVPGLLPARLFNPRIVAFDNSSSHFRRPLRGTQYVAFAGDFE
jgi:hypothetical protein